MKEKQLIAKMEELIQEKDKLINLCEAPQYHEIIKAKEVKKHDIIRLEHEIASLKAEVEREETPINEDDVNAWLDSEDIDTTEIRWGAHFAVTAINAGYLKHNPQNSKR